MKQYLLLWLLLGWANIAFSQIITITNQETGEPLELATLISQNPKFTIITNSKGQADISALSGTDSISIYSLGYSTLKLSYENIASAAFRISLPPSSFNLDGVLVSATRWRQMNSNIPSKITTISPRDVALLNPQTTADLLGISGKVFIQKSQQGGGSPMIRGFATNRLIYTIDGIRMNTAIFRGGNIQNVINVDPYTLEETEVLFGPGSVIYGSDAIGGVMSFQTLTPQFSLNDSTFVKGKASSRYSSANNEFSGHFDVNIGWKKFALVSSFSAWDFDNLKQGSHGPEDYIKDYYVQRQDNMDVVIGQEDPLLQIPSAYSQINFMQKLRFKPSEQWDFEYGFHYSETSPYGRYDRHNRVRNDVPRYGEWDYGPQKWSMNNLKVDHEGDNAMYDRMILRLALQSFEESRISRNINDPVREVRTENVDAFSANLDFTKAMNGKHTLFYGVEFVQNDVASTGVDEDITTDEIIDGANRYPQSEWSSIAAYINDEFRLSNKFTLQGGLRYNQFILDADFSDNVEYYPFPFTTANINNGALTGSLGGVYRPSKSWVVKANFGTAFRSPNVDDIGKVFDSEPGAVVVPNPDLEAEYAYNFDLGIAKTFDDIVKIDVTGFYTILENALVRRDYQLNNQDSIIYDGTMSQVQAIQNAAVAHVYGIQASLEINLPEGFSISSDLNYQKGEEELDDGSTSPSRHAAPLFGISRLNYRANNLSLQFNAMYQAERAHDDLAVDEQGKDEIYALDSEGNTYAPAWYTLNFKAMYDFNSSFRISTGVENLTDQRYRPYSSGISGAGRNFIISALLTF